MIALVDYLSFTCEVKSHEKMAALLEVHNMLPDFELVKPRGNYDFCMVNDGITIQYRHDLPDYKYYIEIKGQGCRTLEDYAKENTKRTVSMDMLWISIFNNLKSIKAKITRLDIALDSHKLLDIYKISDISRDAVPPIEDKRRLNCKMKYIDLRMSSKGITNYFGSPRSDIMIRIYDKGAERGKEVNDWIRCEIQLRRMNAEQMIDKIIKTNNIGKCSAQIIYYYLDFLTGKTSQKQNDKTVQWWVDFLTETKKLRLITPKGREYNAAKLINYLDLQAGSSLSTFAHLFNDDKEILSFVKKDRKLNKKQKLLLKTHYKYIKKC